MKTFFSSLALLLLPVFQVFAHEGETEITNIAEAEWAGPLIAVFVIMSAIFVARAIRRRLSRQIINSNITN